MVFPHLTGPAERAMAMAGQWSILGFLLWGSVPVGPGSEKPGKLRQGTRRGARRDGAEPGSHPSLHVLVCLFLNLLFF